MLLLAFVTYSSLVCHFPLTALSAPGYKNESDHGTMAAHPCFNNFTVFISPSW